MIFLWWVGYYGVVLDMDIGHQLCQCSKNKQERKRTRLQHGCWVQHMNVKHYGSMTKTIRLFFLDNRLAPRGRGRGRDRIKPMASTLWGMILAYCATPCGVKKKKEFYMLSSHTTSPRDYRRWFLSSLCEEVKWSRLMFYQLFFMRNFLHFLIDNQLCMLQMMSSKSENVLCLIITFTIFCRLPLRSERI